MRWDEMKWGEMRWNDVRWVEMRCEMRRDEMWWDEMKWGEMRWGEMRRDEMRFGEMRWNVVRWDVVRWDEIRWDEMKGGEMRWSEMCAVWMTRQLFAIKTCRLAFLNFLFDVITCAAGTTSLNMLGMDRPTWTIKFVAEVLTSSLSFATCDPQTAAVGFLIRNRNASAFPFHFS